MTGLARAAGTGGSVVVDSCQVCTSGDLRPLLFLGYLPPVNTMPTIGDRPREERAYPAQLLQCDRCALVQIGLIVDPAILFPPSYPYTSGTTKVLRDNFAELSREVASLYPLPPGALVVDIGSNDGTLLKNFRDAGHRVVGIEPTGTGRLAVAAGIPTLMSFFNAEAAASVVREHGRAKVITATNVFAHIEGVEELMRNLLAMLDEDGIFISESHYWLSLLETVQYDTIYHEHLRYYSLRSLTFLLAMHGLEPIHVKRIPTHGGSIRVYAARRGQRSAKQTVEDMARAEADGTSPAAVDRFRRRVVASKLGLHALLRDVVARGDRVYAIGAPSRASTLVNYVGLDEGVIGCVLEVPGSQKVGKYMPGTLIPVLDEAALFADQPEHALLLSWHIADELIPKLAAKGYRGDFIVPLPEPRIVRAG
jgi:SAM-dependent methyltransferase